MKIVLYILLPLILFALSFISGMLGLGVAFVSTPVLGLFGFDLKHVIMPWSLLLNGLTAISSAVAFMRSKMVDWRTAIPLLVITTLVAPWLWILFRLLSIVVDYIGVLLFRLSHGFRPETGWSQATKLLTARRSAACWAHGDSWPWRSDQVSS
jgi:uncharacterized membrane protein YfcA